VSLVPDRPQGLLLDLLMGVMNSLAVWTAAAGGPEVGLRWRDAVTARMVAARTYTPYEELVADAARHVGLPAAATRALLDAWSRMEPWPDAAALSHVALPYGFVTNTSAHLARIAADRSRLRPRFTLSAQEAGWFKPEPAVYVAACRQLGAPPGQTIFVAGSPYDAAGATDAGLRAWLVVRRPDHHPTELSIAVATSLQEVVAAIAWDRAAPE